MTFAERSLTTYFLLESSFFLSSTMAYSDCSKLLINLVNYISRNFLSHPSHWHLFRHPKIFYPFGKQKNISFYSCIFSLSDKRIFLIHRTVLVRCCIIKNVFDIIIYNYKKYKFKHKLRTLECSTIICINTVQKCSGWYQTESKQTSP